MATHVPLWWIIIIPLYLILIYGLMFLLGLVKKGHINKFIEFVNIQKVFSYVKEEFSEQKK